MTGKAYKFPDPIEPDGYQCIRVYVPRDTLYLAAFWRAYSFFGEWIAWQRDEAHTAKDVAAIWKVGIDQAREEYESGGCGVDLEDLEFRQNPDEPCLQEYSKDGGETWLLMFDHSLCPCPPSTPNQPPTPPSGGGSSTAANNIVNNLYISTIQQMLDHCADDKATAIADLTAYIRLYDPSYANPSGLGDLYDLVCALPPEEKAFLADSCKMLGLMLPLYESFSECDDPYEDINSWILCANEKVANWIIETSTDFGDAVAEATNDAVAKFLTDIGIWNFAAGGAAGGGGTGFGTTCSSYRLQPFPSATKNLPASIPDGDQECEVWEYEIPAGYRVAAMWVEHETVGMDLFRSVAMGAAPECDIDPPLGGEMIVKGGRSNLEPAYSATRFIPTGTLTGIFDDVGFPTTIANPAIQPFGGGLAVTDMEGEQPLKIVAAWQSSDTGGVSGTVKPILILEAI